MRSPVSLGSLALAVTMVAAFTSTSCFDPQHSDEVNALGGEVNGVGPGEFHRPGQPCLACHSAAGPGPYFAFAGTVYAQRDLAAPQPGVTVSLKDATGTTKTRITNSVGNFYIPAGDWTPVYPVNVTLDMTGAKTKGMVTPIGRNGGCGFCHYGADNELTHMPPVFFQD